ncbi:thiol-disulfide oxidoreductase DCC family protein [Candidatus Nitrosacidococcus tergens]|uniref:Thiol-disulfide oxidoreductase DCC n=1 Tax=Candidatus Nitrosacidococcus tergens TaxID=553981 RepID=A0A7G1Q9R4_9GAMM|nr:DUF393 domain-containing protein [Candidatus Nitrosacidococcus tergens]CAB1276166.1 conserved protein of unknown function [Candidatus Nitrosacidococcus tergens]
MDKRDMSKPIKVYYNSACPVCNAGIKSQKAKMPNKGVIWHDVHTQTRVYHDVSHNLELVRKKLHVIDQKGEVKIGIDAFAEIWRHSPKEVWKSKLITQPVIKQASALGYSLFAEGLYRWNLWKNHWQPSTYQSKD